MILVCFPPPLCVKRKVSVLTVPQLVATHPLTSDLNQLIFAKCLLVFVRCLLVFTHCLPVFLHSLLVFPPCLLFFAHCLLVFQRCLLVFLSCLLVFAHRLFVFGNVLLLTIPNIKRILKKKNHHCNTATRRWQTPSWQCSDVFDIFDSISYFVFNIFLQTRFQASSSSTLQHGNTTTANCELAAL